MNSTTAIGSRFFNNDEKFTIYEGKYNLTSESQLIQLTGTVEFHFYPKPTIRFFGKTEKVDILTLMDEKEIVLEIPGMIPTKAILDSVQNNQVAKGIVLYKLQDNKDFFMDSYYIHVNNFVKYLGDGITKDHFRYRGRVTIEYENWNIELQLRHDYKENKIFSKLKDSNGHDITHIIKIDKKDGGKFKKSDVADIEEILVCIFTLCAGRHIGMPIKICSKQEGDEFNEFSVPLMSGYREVPNWFPKQKANVIESLFRNLASKFKDGYTKRIVKESIHWYVEALNATFIENKLINSQIALEKLSFVLLTQQTPQIISKSKFDSNNFQKNLERILDELSVVTDLSGELNKFSDRFDSGPHLLVKYRNHIAHPKRNSFIERYSTHDKFLINQLGLYYVEILLLNLIGYEGQYSNRLKFPSWEGDYDSLPWK